LRRRTRSITFTPISTPYRCGRRRRRARAAATGCERRIPSTCGSRGHLVDHQLGRELGNAWASGRHEAFADWRAAAAALPSRTPAGSSRGRRRYFDSAKEVWARSYAQAALLRSDDPSLRLHLAGLIESDDVFVWRTADFAPVALEIERVLDSLGLLRSGVAVAA
jgi:hypothetical protein